MASICSPASRSATRWACSTPTGSRSGSLWPSSSGTSSPSRTGADSPWRTSSSVAAPGGAVNFSWRCSATDDAEHLVAPALHVLGGDERLEREAQQRLGVRRAHVEVPVVVVDRDAVDVGDITVGVALLELAHLGLAVGDLGVDLAGDEVLRAVGLEQLAHLLLLDRELLEDQQRRDRAAVGVVEVVEVVVPGDLAAEDRALVAHAGLEERVADAVDVRGAAGASDRVRHGARGAGVVEDRRAGLLLQQVLGEHGREEVAVDEAPGVVDEEAAVGVAVPGDAEVGAGLAHLVDDEAPVLLEQRVGLVVREFPVGLPVGLDELEAEALEDGADH